MSTKPLQKQRDRLYQKQGGKCYYCKKQMVKRWPHRPGETIPDNLATLEHLDSRLNPMRGRFVNELRHAVVCKSCNEAKAAEEVARLGLEELRRRARNGHEKEDGNAGSVQGTEVV